MPTEVPRAQATSEPQRQADATGLSSLGGRVTAALAEFMSRAGKTLAGVGPELAPVAEATAEFVLAGGKRLRPAFCYWGWRCAGGEDSDALVSAAAALELLHACALIHDDVMDGSDTRRGRPAIHRRFAALHETGGWNGSADGFGTSAAILLGDLCLVWADQMFAECGLPDEATRRALPVYSEMRVELMAGQYLDVLAAVLPDSSGDAATERALRVARFKSAKYTIERPLHLGAMLAGGSEELLAAYSAYGLPLGEAFQLRDDVLGVYGDPAVTGKPAGDDLREGKHTALVARATALASTAEAAELGGLVGDPELDSAGVARCRTIIAETGALAEVEQLIARRATEAREAVTSPAVAPSARTALLALAGAVTDRHG